MRGVTHTTTEPVLSVLCPRPVPGAALRLYLLHHAGGSHSTFRGWLPLLPEEWEVHLVVAPGRPRAARHPAVTDLTIVSHALADHLAARADGPFALFGHSMGGLTAFATALELQERGETGPVWVGVSGHPGPFNAITRDDPPLYLLPPEELRDALIRLDGLPERILRDRLLWERVQPLMRADLQAAETYRPRRRPAVLHGPLSAYCGTRDPVADASDAANWAAHTTDFRGVRSFPGGHFYFQDAYPELVAGIVADLDAVLTRRAPAGH
jgi:surfactin synthase thioesterase subunit